MFSFSPAWLCLKQNSLLCCLNSRQVAQSESENSKLQPPESTQARQNSASYWIPLFSLSCAVSQELITPWPDKSATYSYTGLGPPCKEFAAPEQWKHSADVTLHQECWSSSNGQELLFLLSHTFTRSHFGGCHHCTWMKVLLSLPSSPSPIMYLFSQISFNLDHFSNQVYNATVKLWCQHRERSGLEHWEGGRVVLLLFSVWNILKTTNKKILFLQMLQG